MNILIYTIGNQDVKIIKDKKAFEIDLKYYNKEENGKIDILKIKKMNIKRIKWENYEETKEGNKSKLTDGDEISFPLLENTIKNMKNNNYGIKKIFLLYTDRYKIKNTKNKNLEESYFFADIIKEFFNEIKKDYKLNDVELELVNYAVLENGEDPVDDKILSKNMLKNINKIMKNKNFDDLIKEKGKIYLATSAGISFINKKIDIIFSYVYPDNVEFLELSEKSHDFTGNNIMKFRKIKRLQLEIEKNIERYEYTAALEKLKKIKNLNGNSENIEKLEVYLEILKYYFYGEFEEKSENIIENMKKDKKILADIYYEEFESFKNKNIDINFKKENVKKIILKSLRKAIMLKKQDNMWGVYTVIKTAVEYYCVYLIEDIFDDPEGEKYFKEKCCKEKCYKKVSISEIKKLNPKYKDNIEKCYKKEMISVNAGLVSKFNEIAKEIEENNNELFFEKWKNFIILEEVLDEINEKRNKFIHQGKNIDSSYPKNDKNIEDEILRVFYCCSFDKEELTIQSLNNELKNILKKLM
ncbi:hypothetical protein OF820_06625 [Oceanotoga sp. DSM 15011]|uniref:hypothetical protein n=1 Tax=Oceanotoga sp. DSM 15011 TaxID=2984951 RepID=UPI0021F4367F|nr:hypothetical protein [Oceanotoga sp. DSM 15011]UYP01358.1 hypothetical protein OF820_06625 [Oceanotoga sp. DSM 15011]